MQDPRRRTGFGYLVRAHWSEKVSGSTWLARNAFRRPPEVTRRAIAYLADLAYESGAPPPETDALADLCSTYVIEVLQMNERDIDRVTGLAKRIARILATTTEDTEFKKYVFAHREQKRLRDWLTKQDIRWTLYPPDPADVGIAFITAEQWRLLFEPDEQGWFCRDVLLVSVLQELSQMGWRAEFAGSPDARKQLDDDELISEEET
jgi:hypothetical protein